MSGMQDQPFSPGWGNKLLEQLSETPPPLEVSWLPQTSGWVLMLLLLIAVLVYRCSLALRHTIRNAYRRAALTQLDTLTGEDSDYQKLPQLIRKTALYGFDREDITPLTGTAWEHWLDEQCPGSLFSSSQYSGLINQLAFAPDLPLESQQLSALKEQVSFWIKHHRGRYD
jgi:hypothetical protein